MILEKEINIFKSYDFANRFKQISAQFKVQNDKISSIVSEEEFKKLDNEKLTLCSKVSQVEQTADKITWLVREGTSESNFTMTDKAIEIITGSMEIKSKDGKSIIIKDGVIDVEELFAQNIAAKGTIKGVKLEGATGSFKGSVSASSFDIEDCIISIQEEDIQQTCYDVDTETIPGAITSYNFVDTMKAFSIDTDCIVDVPKGVSTSRVFADEVRATDYVSGQWGVFNSLSAYNMYLSIANAQGKYDVVSLETFIKALNSKTADTGWVTADMSSGVFTTYASDGANPARYRKAGSIVSIQGIITLQANHTIEGGTSESLIFTLPESCRPLATIQVLCQGSGSNKWLLTIRTNGAVNFSRYSNGSGYVNATNGVWLPFQATFMAN